MRRWRASPRSAASPTARSALLADIVARPSLTEADFARVRQLRLHRLTQLRDNPSAVADRVFMRMLYGVASLRAHADRQRAGAAIDDHRRRAGVSCARHPSVGRHAGRRRRLRARRDRAARAGCVRRLGGHERGSGRRQTPLPQPAAAQRRAAAAARRSRSSASATSRSRAHARLPRARRRQHGARRAVRQPHQPEPARDKGFTYGARTAFDFRRLPGPFALQVSVQTERDRRGDQGVHRRNRGDARTAADDRR